MSTPLKRLREVVDLLTTVQPVDIRQETDGQVSITKASVEPLIGQLRTAIASSVATFGNGASLPSERNVLNAEALDAYDRIEDAAMKLLAEYTEAIPFLLPEQNIRAASIGIHKAHLDRKLSDADLSLIAGKLQGWATGINRILNPPVTLELMGSCPNCEESHAKLNETDSGRALIIEWHNPDHGFSNALQNCLARCRACRNVWTGDLQLRELAYVLEAKEVNA